MNCAPVSHPSPGYPKTPCVRPPPRPPASARPPQGNQKNDTDAFAALVADDHAGADERVLLDLVVRESELIAKLHEIEFELAKKVSLVLDSPKLASAVAGVLRDTSKISGCVTRRVIEVLKAAGELRSRRLLIDRGGKSDDV